MLPQNKILISIAALMSFMVNLPNALLLVNGANFPPNASGNWEDLVLKTLYGFLFAILILYLNAYKKWELGQKTLFLLAIYIGCSVFFVQTHQFIFNDFGERTGLRLGYFMRNLVLLSVAIIISNYLKSNQEKQILELKNKNLEAAQFKAQLDTLQQQLNPHFLFNALNSLQSLMREDIPKSQLFVEYLSAILRYSLDTQQKPLVTFDKEYHFLQAYLYLLKIRFGEKLKIETQNLEHAKGFLPPLALQLLIENAVNHNEISTQHPLSIFIIFEEKNKTLSVKNNLKPKRMPTQGAGLGLYNLNNRYKMLSQKPIEIIKDEQKFEVIIPILAHENPHY
jgi:two-component system, LytTR family, sensor kinase